MGRVARRGLPAAERARIGAREGFEYGLWCGVLASVVALFRWQGPVTLLVCAALVSSA
jgi:hypothetical protein